MNKQNITLTISSVVYIVICVVWLRFIDFDCDFSHPYNIHGIFVLFSIVVWFILLCSFFRFDGSKTSRWSNLIVELFPYKNRSDSLFRNVVIPTFLWSFFFCFISPILLFFIIGLLCIIGFLLFYSPFDFVFQWSKAVFIVPLFLITVAIGLYFWNRVELGKSHLRFNIIAKIRTVFCIDVYFIGYSLLILGFAEIYFDIFHFIGLLNIDDCKFYDLAKVVVSPFLNIIPGGLLLYFCRRNLNFYTYPENSYYLYLRSFGFDKKEDILLDLLPKEKRQIMKIGNPSTNLFSNLFTNKNMYHDVLYLPSSDWKKHLDYYIHKAYSVISVVDDTQGVVWEMFNHTEYYNKIVFFVDSKSKLLNLERLVAENDELSSSILYQCIHELNKQFVSAPFIFWLKENQCYYDMDISLVSYLLSSKLNATSENYIDLKEYIIDQDVDNIDSTERDTITIVLTKVRKFLSIINMKIPLIFYGLYWVISCIFCLMLFVGAIYVGVQSLLEGDIAQGALLIIFSLLFMGLILFGIKH